MSRRRKAPSPALILALISLFVSIGGVGYAASRIGTDDLKNGAVTKKKLHKKAVSAAKIKEQAVKTEKIADAAVTSGKLGLIETESNVFPVAANSESTAGVQCTAGSKVLGGGAVGNNAGVVLRASAPELEGWFATAKNNTASPATVTVIALCLSG